MIPERVAFSFAAVRFLNAVQQPEARYSPFGDRREPADSRALSRQEQALYDSSLRVMTQYVLGEMDDDPGHGRYCSCQRCTARRGGFGDVMITMPGVG